MPLFRWLRLASRDVVRDRWVRLRADCVEIAPGRIVDPYYVLEENAWVHAVAFDAAHRLLLVRQYRYGAGVFTWELPGGNVDPGEDLFAATQRELAEETGAVAAKWREIGSWYANPARQDNRIHGFLAADARIVAAPELDATEAIESRWFTPAEVEAAIADGTFGNVMHLALYHRALLARAQPGPRAGG